MRLLLRPGHLEELHITRPGTIWSSSSGKKGSLMNFQAGVPVFRIIIFRYTRFLKGLLYRAVAKSQEEKISQDIVRHLKPF